jgi:hypothetical protein
MAINRAPFNALIDDDGSNTVGTVWNKAQIAYVILDPVDAALGVVSANLTFQTNGSIVRNTLDGADSGWVSIGGGGDVGASRGGYLQVLGNESGIGGSARVFLGSAAGSHFVVVGSAGTEVFRINGGGDIVTSTTGTTIASLNSTAVSGGFLAFQRSGTAVAWIGNAQPFGISGAALADFAVYVANAGAARLFLEAYNGSINSTTIYNATSAAAVNMTVESSGRLCRSTSSRRYKTDIQPLDAWRWFLDLEAVEFADRATPDGRKWIGFTAEDVAARGPVRNGVPVCAGLTADGAPDDVTYANLTAVIQLGLKDLDRRLAALECVR